MTLEEVKSDKEHLETEIRLLLSDYFKKHPEQDIEVDIRKHWVRFEDSANDFLSGIEVKVKSTINL